MTDIYQSRILVLDFGSQFTQLIARRTREIGVYCEIYSCYADPQAILDFNPSGIILSGSHHSTLDHNAPSIPEAVFKANVPVLGICYGMQAMATYWNGTVEPVEAREFGYAEVRAHAHSPLLTDIQDRINEQQHGLLDVWMSHGDQVTQLPEGFTRIASTHTCPYAGMAHFEKKYYAIQFHPEVTHTVQGLSILSRFILDICNCQALWTPSHIIQEIIDNLQQQIGPIDKVLLALSGGVDSSVTALLLHRAIGDRLQCVFVDNGLLRLNEAESVMALFQQHLGLNVIKVDAQQTFLSSLTGADEPEQKRKIIGKIFIEVFEQQAQTLGNMQWLAQGTIYPDVIESAAHQHGNAQTIKSHHNVGGLPDTLNLKLIEPLKELFKDEVRTIGLSLGLAHDLLYRHPFPGPGLGVRVVGEIKPEYLPILQQADAIFIEELKRSGWYEKTAQAFVVFLPIKSVGVVGDGRRYGYVVALRAVQTIDFMTAKWAELPYELIAHISSRIINEISTISRVVYDVSSKPPATIEWE